MSEQENQAVPSAPDPPAEDGAPARVDMAPDAVFDLLRAGKAVTHARVRRLKFRGAFAYPVRFHNCTLTQMEFDAATFAEGVCFTSCTLDRPACGKPSTFEKDLDVSHSVLNKAALVRLTVKGKFLALHAAFRGKLVVTDCRFEGRASFWEAHFATWVDFKGCEFAAEADFRSLTADQGFVLTKSKFHGDFLFRGSSVDKKFQADGSLFEGLLDLSKAKLHDFAYLEAIRQGPNQTFAFLNALAERVRVRPEQVEGRLASERAGRFDEAMQEYGLLKRCYQKLYRFDYEDWAFYRFKVCQRRGKPVSWRRPWTVWRAAADYLFLDVGCGYGTNPARAVRMALVIVLAFAAIYAANVEQLHADKDKLPFPDYPADGVLNSSMVGLTTSLAVFTSGMGGVREVAKGWLNVPVMVESVMGTLLFGLFIVAFSRKVIR